MIRGVSFLFIRQVTGQGMGIIKDKHISLVKKEQLTSHEDKY